jgi:homoserine O-acetyltransferase
MLMRIILFIIIGLYMFNTEVTLAQAQTFSKEKREFSMPSLTFFNGQTISDVRVGWEAYGSLNEAKDNAILITHYFTGNSHAAGQYEEDGEPGYWDVIIGPGKAIDTDIYYVIAVDTLANLGVHDPYVITTGPASINPKTNKPYGLSFPVITMRDQVNVQKALIESLGITKLHAVIGASMGSMQALEWASAYPEMVPRVAAVIGSAHSDAWTTTALEHWSMPIKLDANWNNGDYYDNKPPIAGLTAALMAITQTALHPDYMNLIGTQLGHFPLEEAPLMNITSDHAITTWLKQRAAERAEVMDANHLLYLVRACQLYMAGQKDSLKEGLTALNAKVLLMPASNDLLLMPYHLELMHQALTDMGKSSELIYLDGDFGHLNGLATIAQANDALQEFLKSSPTDNHND